MNVVYIVLFSGILSLFLLSRSHFKYRRAVMEETSKMTADSSRLMIRSVAIRWRKIGWSYCGKTRLKKKDWCLVRAFLSGA